MSKALPFLIATWCVWAQVPNPSADPKSAERIPSEKAAPEVNSALMKRVNGFYQAHVDGKFRIADQYVAEESKDAFFASSKPKYEGFDIMKIAYLDNFTKAEVTVATKGIWMIRGEKMTTRVPTTSNWKLIDGEWYWYAVPVAAVQTPFGTMHFDSGVTADPGARRALPADPAVLAQKILASVKTDKQEVLLKSYEPATAEVKVTNGMPGAISLKVQTDAAPTDLVVRLDKDHLAAGEVATVTLSYAPPNKSPKPSAMLRITVDPLGSVLPVKILFAIPPEVQQQIDKIVQPTPKVP